LYPHTFYAMKNYIHKIEINVLALAQAEASKLKAYRSKHPDGPKSLTEKFIEDDKLWKASMLEPMFVQDAGLEFYYRKRVIRDGYLYQDSWYIADGEFTRERKKLLILDYADRERIHFEKLWHKFYSDSAKQAVLPLERISEEVKIAVWRRDQGRCADCGSKERLEFHHIIPRNKGGSSTVRNVELLCESCNRKKGDRLDELPLSF
jgi:hypothetical protein